MSADDTNQNAEVIDTVTEIEIKRTTSLLDNKSIITTAIVSALAAFGLVALNHFRKNRGPVVIDKKIGDVSIHHESTPKV